MICPQCGMEHTTTCCPTPHIQHITVGPTPHPMVSAYQTDRDVLSAILWRLDQILAELKERGEVEVHNTRDGWSYADIVKSYGRSALTCRARVLAEDAASERETKGG